MFDFFKEVIINTEYLPIEDGVDESGNRFKRFYAMINGEETGTGNTKAPKSPIFRVLRCADYANSGIADKVVYKTNGRYGTNASVVFDLTSLAQKAGTYRLIMDIGLISRYYSDYEHSWSEFHKPVMVEFTVGASDSATTIATKVKDQLKKYVPDNYKYVAAVSNGVNVKVSCTDPYQVIKTAKIQVLTEDGCAEGCSDVTYSDVLDGTITANKAPFATGEWITENLRFPSYPNLRYTAPNSDERPIDGALYVQYSFGYCSPRRGLTGQGTVGQVLSSVTHHTFYVLASLAPAFETELKKGLPDAEIKTVGDELIILNATGSNPVVSYNAPIKMKKSELEGSGVTVRVNLAGGDADVSDIAGDCTITVDPSSVFNVQGGNTIHATEVEVGTRGVITAKYKNLITTANLEVIEG